jgi:precorrin-6Y C5,15-methyltransferase (decarboxylating)
MGNSRLVVLEALGGRSERVRGSVAKEFGFADVAALNIVALEVAVDEGAPVVPLSTGLDDTMFEHDGQLTKRDVRAVTLSALAPCQGELLWDIGLGSGSIAIEWLLRHPSLKAVGIECDPDRAARAARNAAALGTPDLRIVEGRAPDALKGLPRPDVVFIGGGLSSPAVFDAAWSALGSGGRLVANGVSLATEARLIELFRKHGGDLVRIDVSRAGKAGSGDVFVWRAASPIVQWRARKP